MFVARSFDDQFDFRWNKVIAPAISQIEVDGTPLKPIRVDIRGVSDSIITEILQGIANHLVVFADVSTIAYVGDKAIRNANVLYEVGVAHATRLPEEVILFRSDRDDLIFDIANVRVNDYDPENQEETARSLVADSIISALNEVELKKHLAVRRAIDSIDFQSWMILAEAQRPEGVTHPLTRDLRQAPNHISRVRGIERLLEFGALETEFLKITPEYLRSVGEESAASMLGYHATSFGLAMFLEAISRMDMLSPDVQKMLEEYFQDYQQGIRP